MSSRIAGLLALTVFLAGPAEVRAQGVRTVAVSGRLVNWSGAAITRGGVQLFLPGADSLDGNDGPEESYTDSLGEFVARGPLKTGCYTLVARAVGYGITVRTLWTITGSANVGMMTMHSGPFPEMPTYYMLECDPPATHIGAYAWGNDDTVRVEGTINVPMQRK